jgi:hypothetical protein
MSAISTLFGNNDALANLIESRQRLSASRNNIFPTTTDAVKSTINKSQLLDKASKQTLSRLTDSVSQFAGDNPKLLRDIMGISNILQIGAKPEANSATDGPYAQLLSGYYGSKYPTSRFKIDA